MARYDSNLAYVYDGAAAPERGRSTAPQPARVPAGRPHLDVYTGEGREANQLVSPVFTHVVKVFCVLVALFFAIGVARVTIASVTAAYLNANAEVSSSLEAARDESSNLEVMNSVYGSDTRIRDLATGTLGMVEPEGSITLDLSEGDGASASAAEGDAAAADAADPAPADAQ